MMSTVFFCVLVFSVVLQSLSLRFLPHKKTISALTRKQAFINEENFESDSVYIFKHLGDYEPSQDQDSEQMKRLMDFNLNMGRAMEVLRRELPMAFHVSNLDFSIFANQITVCNGNALNKISLPKSVYSAAVKSLRVASTISFTQPCMNVKKIEYVEDCRTIQCLVDVVLPDTVRIEGQSTWQGMFYFGLDRNGLIETHIFDRKITNYMGKPIVSSGSMSYPWLQSNPRQMAPMPIPQYAAEQTEEN